MIILEWAIEEIGAVEWNPGKAKNVKYIFLWFTAILIIDKYKYELAKRRGFFSETPVRDCFKEHTPI